MVVDVTVAQLRTFSGAPTQLITDDEITTLFDEVRATSLEEFKVSEEPTLEMDLGQGNGGLRYLIRRRFPLKITGLRIENDDIDLDDIVLNHKTGLISFDLSRNSTISNFSTFPKLQNSVKVKFLNAFMDKTDVVKESSTDLEVGTSVVLTLDNATNLVVGDWILIESFNPRTEIARIKNITGNNVTVDRLVHSHESGSIVTKMTTSQLLQKFIIHETCVAISGYAVGNTYTFNTSYNIEGVSAVRGVPYPHWEKNLNYNQEKRNYFFKQINKRLITIV